MCNGKPVVKYHKTNKSNTNQYFIGCSLYTFGTRHRYISPIKKVDTFFILKDTFCILRDTSRYV